jgi:SWI/SNF-related matrix-associated actin-dependent regulator of chromatin subfamily A3
MKVCSPFAKLAWAFQRLTVRLTAHLIRNQSTKQFHAVRKISANRKWCLTGTPIQNRLEDVGALVRFLRIPLLDSSLKFQRHIIEPCSRNTPGCDQNLRLLLGSICLRRTKSYLDVPEAIFKTVHLQLSTEEQVLYSKIIEMSRRAIDEAVSNKSAIKRVNGMLTTIHRIRMLCDLGTHYQRIISKQPFGEVVGQHQPTPELSFDDQTMCDLCYSPLLPGPDYSSLPSCTPSFCPSCLGESNPVDSQLCELPIRNYMPTHRQGQQMCDSIVHFQKMGLKPPSSNSSSPDHVSSGKYSDTSHSTKLSAVLNNIEENLKGSKRCFYNSLFYFSLREPLLSIMFQYHIFELDNDSRCPRIDA